MRLSVKSNLPIFSKDSDVKSLYDKAKEIEIQITNAEYTGNPSPVHRLFDVAEKLEEKAVSRLQIPENILKRLLQNVYFIMGDGIDVADELGRRYGMFVYHTCNYRHIYSQNADPKFQPELCRDVQDFFSLDPEDAMLREFGVVHDYTPMVIMDLIQLTAKHEKVICENDIDIDSIIQIVSHAVIISNDKSWDNFISGYEKEIRRRNISESEKEKLIRKVDTIWGKGKPENPRGTTKHGVKQIFRDDNSSVEQIADMAAEYFGLGGHKMSKKIEDVITGTLKNNTQKNALDFIAYLRGDENISLSSDDNDEGRWWIRDKNNLLCELQMKAASDDSPEGWEVWFYGDSIGGQDSIVDESIKEIAWASITLCGNCGAGCAPGKPKTVFGKVIENVCQSTLGFTNPETHILDCMKKIMESR